MQSMHYVYGMDRRDLLKYLWEFVLFHSWNISTNLRIPDSLAGLSDHTNASCSEEVCDNIVESHVEDAYRSLSSKPVQVDIQHAKHRYGLETTSSRNFL